MAASTLVDLVQVSTATTGTGTITLGSAVAHFRGSSALTDGATYDYRISDGTTDYEIGSGVYTASGTTLTRTVSKSSNANAAINLSGTATVTITALSATLSALNPSDVIFFGDGSDGNVTVSGAVTADRWTIDTTSGAATGGVVAMDAKLVNGQVMLTFPWANPNGAAVFRRGDAI